MNERKNMGYCDTEFYRILGEEEKIDFHKSGNIQSHNDIVCPNFEYLTNCSNHIGKCDDSFYSQLYKVVRKNELAGFPIWGLIFMEAVLILFLVICICFGLRMRNMGLLFGGILPAAMFSYFTYVLIKEFTKISRVLKCVKERGNIYAVSLKIDGIRTYTDTSDDAWGNHYYIYSEPMIIRVPQKIYSAAAPNKRLTGAVIDIGKEKLFYALHIN